jgi:hypothetical protein
MKIYMNGICSCTDTAGRQKGGTEIGAEVPYCILGLLGPLYNLSTVMGTANVNP